MTNILSNLKDKQYLSSKGEAVVLWTDVPAQARSGPCQVQQSELSLGISVDEKQSDNPVEALCLPITRLHNSCGRQ